MKKVCARLMALILVVAMLTGCGASSEQKAAQELINAIGTVSLESGDAISAAEEAVAALEQKDKDKLDLTVLEDARKQYDALVKADEDAKVKAVEDAIKAIGEVTPDSEAAIQAARKAFDELDASLQSKVSNVNDLANAENAYQGLLDQIADVEAAIDAINTADAATVTAAQSAYDALPDALKSKVSNVDALTAAQEELNKAAAAEVDALIDAIGEVSLESEEAINKAQTAYDALSEGAKAFVAKASTLESAKATFDELKTAYNQQVIDELLPKMDVEVDSIYGYTFYMHPSAPEYTDIRPYVMPYVGVNKQGYTWLGVEFDYTGNDWIFWETLIFSVDGDLHYKFFSYFDVVRDNAYGVVWEYVNTVDLSASDILTFKDMADADTVVIRFQGDDYYYDLELSEADKAAIGEIMDLYYALGGE